METGGRSSPGDGNVGCSIAGGGRYGGSVERPHIPRLGQLWAATLATLDLMRQPDHLQAPSSAPALLPTLLTTLLPTLLPALLPSALPGRRRHGPLVKNGCEQRELLVFPFIAIVVV